MDIKAFKNKKNRRLVKGKSGNKNIGIQIINYDSELYKKWSDVIDNLYKSGNEEIQLTDEQINDLFNDFTNIKLTVDELNDILDDPNHVFSIVFLELQIILNEIIEKYLQQKQFEIATTKRVLEETNVMLESEKLQKIISCMSQQTTDRE